MKPFLYVLHINQRKAHKCVKFVIHMPCPPPESGDWNKLPVWTMSEKEWIFTLF